MLNHLFHMREYAPLELSWSHYHSQMQSCKLVAGHMMQAAHTLTEAHGIHRSHLENNLVPVGYSQMLLADCNCNQSYLLELLNHQGLVVAEKTVVDYSNHNHSPG